MKNNEILILGKYKDYEQTIVNYKAQASENCHFFTKQSDDAVAFFSQTVSVILFSISSFPNFTKK
jgi:hypothetical protein